MVYASGANGIAGDDPKSLAENLEPLFECIVREVSLGFRMSRKQRPQDPG